MAETHVISALVNKRSELSGLITHYKKELSRLSEEVKTLDAAIKLFEPDYELEGIKTKQFKHKNNFFKHGECSRMMLNYLRVTTSPLSTQDLTLKVMMDKDLELSPTDQKALRMTIYSTLSPQAKKGLIRMDKADGSSLWELVNSLGR